MSNEREKVRMQHRGRGPMGRGMQPGEKPKDLKGSLGKLLSQAQTSEHQKSEKSKM